MDWEGEICLHVYNWYMWCVYVVFRCFIISTSSPLQGERFAQHSKLDNRKLLWHGTNVAVVAAIMKTGLRIMPHSGGRVGKGIYFASEHSKSAGYGESGGCGWCVYRRWWVCLLGEIYHVWWVCLLGVVGVSVGCSQYVCGCDDYVCLVGVVLHLLRGGTLVYRFDMGNLYSSEV